MKKEEVKPKEDQLTGAVAVQTPEALAVVAFDSVEAGLSELETRINAAVYDVTTTAGMSAARLDRKECITIRGRAEDLRVERNAPRLAQARADKALVDKINLRVKAVEDRVDKLIKEDEAKKAAVKAEKDRLEALRKSAIVDRIDKIKDLPRIALDAADSLELEEFIAKVEARQLGTDFAEFLPDAQAAKTEAVTKLNEMLVSLKAKEAEAARVKAENEAEAARLEEQRIQQEKDKAEQDRLNAIEQEKLAAERAELEQLREEKRLKDEAELKERNLAESRRLKILTISNVALTAFNEGHTSKGLEQIISETEKTECNGDAEMIIAVDKALNDLRSLQAKRAEEERAAAQKLADDAAKQKAEAEKLAKQQKAEAEKREKEAADRLNALTATHLSTLQAILDMARDTTMSAPAIVQGIIHLAELGIKKGK